MQGLGALKALCTIIRGSRRNLRQETCFFTNIYIFFKKSSVVLKIHIFIVKSLPHWKEEKTRWFYECLCFPLSWNNTCFQLPFAASARTKLRRCVACRSRYAWRALHGSHQGLINRPLEAAASISNSQSLCTFHIPWHSPPGERQRGPVCAEWKRITVGMCNSQDGGENIHVAFRCLEKKKPLRTGKTTQDGEDIF